MTGNSMSPLEQARHTLRTMQSDQTVGVLPSSDQPVTPRARQLFREFTAFTVDPGTGRLRRGPFSFEPDLEQRRIARGEEIIRRVDPGPFEDPSYFAMLAYEAASLELAGADIAAPGSPDHFARFLFGTVHVPDVNAFTHRADADDYSIVLLNSGLIEFAYQAAKAVVEAIRPELATGKHPVVAKQDLDAVRRLGPTDPPVERLYRTLEAYFFGGYPRASYNETVPGVQHPMLAHHVQFTERWIMGHEYGHAMAPRNRLPPPAGANLHRAGEYFADNAATMLTVFSAGKLDAVPPEIPLSSAIFALSCLDVVARALHVARLGVEPAEPVPGTTHPSPRARAANVIALFRQYFDVQYDDEQEQFDLRFTPRPEAPAEHGLSTERANRTYYLASVLHALWRIASERVRSDHRAGRRLHRMWQFAS
jgi:hypothetical protein